MNSFTKKIKQLESHLKFNKHAWKPKMTKENLDYYEYTSERYAKIISKKIGKHNNHREMGGLKLGRV